MRTLISGNVWVHYGQIYAHTGAARVEEIDLHACFGGQRNGLCGAARPGMLWLTTGLHTGTVGFEVELHDACPPVGDDWEEVVEVSFRVAAEVVFLGWSGQWTERVSDLADGDYRVRYCGRGMDEARAAGASDPEVVVESHLLQFWPAPPAPDAVLRQTSRNAAYWHDFAGKLAPPSGDEQDRAATRQQLIETATRRPDDKARRLRGLSSAVRVLAELDRPMLDAVCQVDADTQRELARWVTRRACAETGLADVEWIAPALTAMERGEPLPPPFDDAARAWDRLEPDGPGTGPKNRTIAFRALLTAGDPDPLRAAVRAVWAGVGAFGPDGYLSLLSEIRAVFPALAS